MAQFKVFEKGIMVNGKTIHSVIDGFDTFKSLAIKYLLESNIGESKDEEIKLDLEGWYPQESWLNAFEKITLKAGESTLKKIGASIPDNAVFPPWVKDCESGIKAIDIAYHMNHQKNGKIMFNPDTGTMVEGIGHYGFEKVEGKNLIISECNNPYPCKFDYGIISALVSKFTLNGKVIHDDSKPCRRNGADSCTYIITW